MGGVQNMRTIQGERVGWVSAPETLLGRFNIHQDITLTLQVLVSERMSSCYSL